VQSINRDTGEILSISTGGLYAPLPIPAYQILAQAGEHVAKDVLVCLVSHMGKASALVWPSYGTIQKVTGRSRGAIAGAINLLEEYGFIRVIRKQVQQAKRRNFYYILEAAYKTDKMNTLARAHLAKKGRCSCGAVVSQAEIGRGSKALHHYGCGEKVKLFSNVPPIPLYSPPHVTFVDDLALTSSISSEPMVHREQEI
jgi:hypothetical protein